MPARTAKGSAVVTLPSATEIEITRVFDAPPRLVYEAWTTPELVRQWWHANRGQVTSVEMDLRVGGLWRWVMVTPRGVEVAFRGEYRELVPGERLVYTEIFEGAPGAAALTRVSFTPQGDQTLVTIRVEHRSQAERDAHLNSGMEPGMQDALDLLEIAARSLA